MLSVARTFDYSLIRDLATSYERVWNAITDDESPSREEWSPVEDERLIYLVASIDGVASGYWMLNPHTSYLWEVHTVLLPKAWGEAARSLSKMGIEWMWENTSALRLFTHVPEFNRVALKFAKAAGFEEYGVHPDSFLKCGKLHSVVLLGLSKPDAGRRSFGGTKCPQQLQSL